MDPHEHSHMLEDINVLCGEQSAGSWSILAMIRCAIQCKLCFLCDNLQMFGCLKWAKWTALSSNFPLPGAGHACSEILPTAFRSMTSALLQVLLPIYSMGKCLGRLSVVWEMQSGLNKLNSMWTDILHSRSMNSSPWPRRMALNLILNCAVADLLFLRLTLSRKTVIFSDQKVHLMPTYFLSPTDERSCGSVQWHISIHEKYISIYPECCIIPS